jgi:hypothetical protein
MTLMWSPDGADSASYPTLDKTRLALSTWKSGGFIFVQLESGGPSKVAEMMICLMSPKSRRRTV